MTDEDILTEARDRLKECVDAEASMRAEMLDDLHFCTLDQWDAGIRKDRENDPNGPRPCLTIDKINQYIVQVVNDIRKNRPSIQTRPVDDAADIETAKVFKGLVRHIEDQSNASIAYETSGQWTARCGLGYFRITTDYVSPDSFDQEILIKPIPNTFAVYLGPHTMPDGSDAEYGFVIEEVPLKKFQREHPKAKTKDEDFVGLAEVPSWKTQETITVAEYFRTVFEDRELVFLEDGQTMFADEYEALPQEPVVSDRRKTQSRKIEWRKITGIEVLETRDWAGQYIPIIEVVGNEAYVDGRRIVWGLVRPAKDSLRMYNYWASTITERMALAPKPPFVGAKGQFEGLEEAWRNANKENRAYLEYNPVDVQGNPVPAPKRQEPTPVEIALVQQMKIIEHDVQTSLGMFKASVGESESQQSGRAILALQRESDTGTFHFSDNLARSIRYAGRIIVDLAPKVYDTRRILRIIGEDGEATGVMIDPQQQTARRDIRDAAGKVRRIYNLGVGKYDVTVTVGPSYTTARQEAATVLTELANSAKDPTSAAVMRYLAIKNSDFHGSEEMVRMLKALLPPQLQQPEDGQQQQIPPAIAQKMMQMQQGMQMMGEELQKAKAGENATMMKVAAQEREAQAELALKAQAQQQELALERAKVEAQLSLEREKAQAQCEIESMKMQANMQCESMKMDHQKKMDTDRLAFEKDQKMAADPNYKDVAMMPQVMDGMQQMAQGFAGIGQALQQLVELQQQTLAEMRRAKSVTVGGLRRVDGQIVGGTVSVQ